MTGKELTKLGGALLVGAALAFPAGLLVAGWADPGRERPPPRSSGSAEMRNVYSPAVSSDPWFLEQQRAGVEALENHCRSTGESCAAAREARRALEELERGG